MGPPVEGQPETDSAILEEHTLGLSYQLFFDDKIWGISMRSRTGSQAEQNPVAPTPDPCLLALQLLSLPLPAPRSPLQVGHWGCSQCGLGDHACPPCLLEQGKSPKE